MSFQSSNWPIELQRSDTSVVIRFVDPGAMMLEVPEELEQELRNAVGERRGESAERRIVMDLEGVSALTSRQLGVLLLLRNVFGPPGTVTLRNVAQPVHDLLHLTRMNKLFTIELSVEG